MVTKVKIGVIMGVVEEVLLGRGMRELSGNILYLDLGGDYTTVDIQN